MSRPAIVAEVTFLRPEEGGRQAPPSVGYRPHVVVETGGVAESDYLGVWFARVPGDPVLGEQGEYELVLVYPEADYTALQAGAEFTVREGPHIVGYGRAIRLDNKA